MRIKQALLDQHWNSKKTQAPTIADHIQTSERERSEPMTFYLSIDTLS